MDQTNTIKPESSDIGTAANQKQHVTQNNTNTHQAQQGQSAKDSEHDGTWLLITSTMGLTLGYVRIDDHDHPLALSEIRGMISSKLDDNNEYAHGWQFGTGWPLKVVPRPDEHDVLAKDVLPAVSVLSAQSAQHRVMNGVGLEQPSGAMMIGTANLQGLQPLAMNAMSAIFTPLHQQGYYQHSANAHGVTLLQPMQPQAHMLEAQAAQLSQGQMAMLKNEDQAQGQTVAQTESGKSSLTLLSANSTSSLTQIPSLPPFSPPALPALSEEQLAAKAKEQRKKLLNLLPRKANMPGSMLHAAMAHRVSPMHGAQSGSAETGSKKKSSGARTMKPSLPRLKPMDVDGKVIELPPETEEAAAAAAAAFPSEQAQRDLFCSACEKTFECERGYRSHMRKMHGIKLTRGRNKERRFGCARDGCGKSFYQRSDLRRHERVHLGVKPFECSLCRKQFTQRGSLYRHIKGSHKEHDPRTLVTVNGAKEKENESELEQNQTLPNGQTRRVPKRHIVEGSDVQDLPPPLISAMPPPLMPLEGKEQVVSVVEGKEQEAVEQK